MATQFPEPTKPLCLRDGCIEPAMTDCSYIDSYGSSCGTSWCQNHIELLDEGPFCIRHSGVVQALRRSATPNYRPRLDTRAPSLANWVANELDTRIRSAMQALPGASGGTLHTEALAHVDLQPNGGLRWLRSWRLDKADGTKETVQVDVDEATEVNVRLTVNDRVVASVVPPWIAIRQQRTAITEEDGERIRQTFYSGLIEALEEALTPIAAAE